MTFLAPAALLGVFLLAIPIVVHLFKPRKMKQTPFSSLRWLKQTQQRLSRRIQWHQWLLFLVRAACILFLVLALGKPLIGSFGERGPTDRIIIVDTSRSMAYKPIGLTSPWEKAQQLAGDYLKSTRVGDRTALILTGSPPRLVTPLVEDASSHLATLNAARPGQADTTLSAALPLVRSLIEKKEGREIELVFLTDNLKQRWAEGAVKSFEKSLPVPARVQVIGLGTGSAHNAWIANARHYSLGEGNESVIVAEILKEGDPPQKLFLRLTGINGLEEKEEDLAPRFSRGSAGKSSIKVAFQVPATVTQKGQVAELRLEPPDSLPSDDRYFVNMDVSWALYVLLIESAGPGNDGRSVGIQLRDAVDSLTASKRYALEMKTVVSTAVTAADIQKADVVIMAGVEELAGATLETLESRVRSGAGLVVFLGPHLKPDFYNDKFHRALQPTECLFPLPLKAAGADVVLAPGERGELTDIRWAHPLLAPLSGTAGNLSGFQFRVHALFGGQPSSADNVLARFDNKVPAIIERAVGAGRVITLNTTANPDWSDLPIRKDPNIFVPLVHRLLTYLAGGSIYQRSFTVGDEVVLPLANFPSDGSLTVTSPSGAKVSSRLLKQAGKTLLFLGEVNEAGKYRVQAADQAFAFVVNASRRDSTLARMDDKVLADWWAPTKLDILTAGMATERLVDRSTQWPVGPTLIVLAGLLLVLETLYITRLCPRANPIALDVERRRTVSVTQPARVL